MPRRLFPVLLVAACLPACQPEAGRRGATVLYASGADLQSINPLLTQHPLARQVQRYVLLTTLARYDSALAPAPYLARGWHWSGDRRTLTFVLQPGVRWHDGTPTTAHDVAWTLGAARDPGTGYPRLVDLEPISEVVATTDSTAVLRFREPQERFPDVLTDLAILPAHLLDTVQGLLDGPGTAHESRPIDPDPDHGHAAGQELAFFSISLAPQMALLVTGTGLLIGTVVLVAQADGAGRPELAGRIWRLALLIAAALGTLFAVVLMAGEPILLLLGQEPEIAAGGGRVLAMFAPGMPAIMMYIATTSFLEGVGRSAARG